MKLIRFVLIAGLLLTAAYWASQHTDISQRVHHIGTPAGATAPAAPAAPTGGAPIPEDGP